VPLPPTTPELHALDVYVSVVELGSLSRAAARHHITQPSVSGRIRTLERQLGLTLLERTPNGSHPTVAGRVVAEWAEGVLRSAEELNVGVAALKAQRSGRLRVAASLTIGEYLLPGWLQQFVRRHPGDAVTLDVANSTAVLDLLRRGRADLGFIESPGAVDDMTEQVVAHDRLRLVVGRSHPWARRQSISVDAVVTTPMVLREPGSGTREAFEAALRGLADTEPIAALELGSTAAIRAAVIGGGPPTVISERAIEGALEVGDLIALDVPGLEVSRRLRAVWPRTTELSTPARDLLDVAVER